MPRAPTLRQIKAGFVQIPILRFCRQFWPVVEKRRGREY